MARKGIKEPVDAMAKKLEAMGESRVRVGVSTYKYHCATRLRPHAQPQPGASKRYGPSEWGHRAVQQTLQRRTTISAGSLRAIGQCTCYLEL
jgi:cytochrome c5